LRAAISGRRPLIGIGPNSNSLGSRANQQKRMRMPHSIIGIIGTALVVLIEVAVILALWGPPNWNRIERRTRHAQAA
jgi:ABC-type uncharacterized transport system YnjBCD permease subunit